MPIQNEITIKLESFFSSRHLSLRYMADMLFDEINKLEARKIIIDFNKIRTVSRSFAHQYLILKKRSKKTISEINKNKDVEKMFKIVATSKTRPADTMLAEARIASLSTSIFHLNL